MDTYEHVGSRIKQLREETTSLSQSDLARELGITPQAVQKWEAALSEPRLMKLQQIADVLGVDIAELLRGTKFEIASADFSRVLTGSYTHPARRMREVLEKHNLSEHRDTDLLRTKNYEARIIGGDVISVPRFDARGSMGDGFPLPEHDNVIEHIQVTASWVRETLPSITSPKNLALMPAFGDSMEGTFGDGDMLWVDRGVNEVKIDAVYVLALRDELYVKRLQRRPDGSVLMISDNKAYEPYLIENGEREKFQVLGRVVFAWRGKRL